MKFTINGVEYRLGFQYTTKKTGKKKVRNYTTCRIETGDERDNTHQVVLEGTVVRYQYDKFEKETARQYALDAALENLVNPSTTQVGQFIRTLANCGDKSLTLDQIYEVVKTFCSAAHTAYHRRPGGLDYKVPVQTATASAVK
jgi:hypothetical protein